MTDINSTLSSVNKIFFGVKYFITGTLPENIKKILDDGGGEKINFFSDMVTHCIVADQPKENDLSDAKDLYEVPAVTPYWILLSAFCNKILPTKGFTYDKNQIFSDIIVTASQISNADFKAIWAMITFYGGKFKSCLDSSCTHLITGKPFGRKYELAVSQESLKIVTPNWVVECIKAGGKIEENFFHPKYLVLPKPRENSPPAGDLSTAQILGFADDVTPTVTPLTENPSSLSSTQALLEKLKQRMPWNRPSTVPSCTTTQMSFTQSSYTALPQNKLICQSQTQIVSQSQVPPLASSLSNNPANQQISSQSPQQMTLDQQNRVIQSSVWRPTVAQNIKPQYALIQRDGAIVQAQTSNWSHFHSQSPRLQQPGTVQLSQQQQVSSGQPNHPTQNQTQSQPLQQSVVMPNSQIHGQQQGAGSGTGGIQVQGSQTGQRQITWSQQPQLQGPPKQVIQLDPQTHAQLSQMDPHQRTLFLQKIQRQRQIILQQRQLQLQHQQQHQQQRQVVQTGPLNNQQQQQSPVPQQQQSQQQPPQNAQQQQSSSVPLRQQQIIIRGVMPPGLTTQQQAVWLHQQQFIRQQQILVQQQTGQIRQPVSVSQQRVVQQQTATSTWIPQQADNQQQQQQQQLQLQRQQQMRLQQLQIQKQQQIVVQRATSVSQQFQQASNQQSLGTPTGPETMPSEDPALHVQTTGGVGVGAGLLVNSRTKTALANMLSSRLQTGHLSPQAQVIGQTDGSAAGQLRLMSAQQRNQPPPPPPPPPPQASQVPQPNQLSDSQTNLYNQQRRTLGNITNAGPNVRPTAAPREPPPSASTTPVPKSPARGTLNSSASPSATSVSQKPQFFAHNPNLRIPPDKYFLGCVFFFVEYDRSDENYLMTWEEIIRDHGGEVETSYTHRVTHVLCETQKHGIVQQALRDGKRCITAFWLNDVVLRGNFSVPWLALHFPVPFGKEKPLSKYFVTLSGFEDKSERERVATMIQIAGGQYRNYLSPLTHIVVCKKAEGAKYKKAKETNKVTVNVQWLNEILFGHYTCIQQPDAHKYQQYNLTACFRVDYGLIPHLMGAWKLPINVTSEVYNSLKNSPPLVRKTKKPRIEPTADQLRELEDKILESVQVINLENFTSGTRPHVMITGDKNFEMAKKAKELGCTIVRNNSKVTHLVVCGKPMRTLKMLKCLITANFIVKDSWLIDSSAQNEILGESPYIINQVDNDDFKCNITKVLASPNRRNLFKDKIFYMTPNVEPSRNALGELILLSGGQVEKQRRSVKSMLELNKASPTYIVISCYNDLALIADVFRAKLEFYSAEFIMKSITTQAIDYSSSVYRY